MPSCGCTTSTPAVSTPPSGWHTGSPPSSTHVRRSATHPALDSALDGADFVINAVNVGGHAATLVDFDVPEQFGLRQTIGDTLGVGGIFRALRTFPVLDSIAETMQRVCPDAWLLNYTNPMSMNLTYLAARHPRVKAVGLCHSVYWTVHALCELLGVPLDGTRYLAAGVNHQAWLLRWEHDGEDLYGRLDERIAADPELRRGCASTCTAGSGATRPRRASTPASTCRGTCTTTPRSSGCGSRWATTSRSAPATWPSTRRPARCSTPTSRWRRPTRRSTPRR